MTDPRRGMTLIEILVAVMILSVISLAMIGILLTSGELFRRGEAGKTASDESITVLAKLEDDLARMVPLTDGGFLYVESNANPVTLSPQMTLDGAGSGVVAFVIDAKDPSTTSAKGGRSRRLVAWWTQKPTAPDDRPILWRADMPSADADEDPNTRDEEPLVQQLIASPTPLPANVNATQITTGALHFAGWTSTSAAVRGQDWDSSINQPDTTLHTEIGGHEPDALRITLVLSGGTRFAQRGTLRRPIAAGDTGPFPVAGVGSVSTQPGSMLRIGDEWIAYDGYDDGFVRMNGASVGRGKRRSADQGHAGGDIVHFGPAYTLVRTIPR